MPSKVDLVRAEARAYRIMRDLYTSTGGKPGHWAMLHSITRRLALKSAAATDAAVELARAKGWIEVRDGEHIRLTEDGRHVAWPT